MSDASRDQNFVTTLLGVSNADGTTPVTIYADPVTHRLLIDTNGSGGSPGGSDTQVQYNNAGSFGGITGATSNGTVMTLTNALATTAFSPSSNDGATLGSGLASFSDLFLASGGVINFNNGNYTITHSAGLLTFSGGVTASAGTVTLATIAGAIDAGAATSFEIPNGAAPTVNADGEIAFDTTVTDFSTGLLKFFGNEEQGVVSMPIAQFTTPTNGYVVAYNSTNDEFELVAQTGGSDNITIGTTTITSGTTTRILYNNAGVVGEYVISGTGDVAMTNSPTFVTPALGTPSSGTVTNLTGTASININGTVGATTPTTATFTTATINTSLLPDANDGAVLGAAATAFSDLFLASGAVINWAAGDITITHATNDLTFGGSSGAANGFFFSNDVSPTANDGAALGKATTSWSDAYLASGATINFANGNSVITHSSGILTVSTGDLRVTTAGTNTASVVTVGGTQTLTAKTLTSPTINTATIGGATPLAEGASIDLDPSLSADGTYTGIAITGTAGATLAFGDIIYLAAADSRWELADASAASTSGSVLVGICVLAAAADGSATKILLQGNIRADTAFPALTISAPVYISETAGDVTNTAPTTTDSVTRVLGFALTADSMYFNPSGDYITHT